MRTSNRSILAVAIATVCLVIGVGTPALASPASDLAGKHVLLIPVAEGGKSGAKLDKRIRAAVSATGATAVPAKVRKSDITAITGCAGESADCYDQIALTLGVDHIVFGKVTPQDGGDVVSLTLVGGGNAPRTGSIKLETGTTRDQAFQAAVTRFLVAKPELTSAPLPATTPAKKPDPASPSGYDLGRVKRSSWIILGGGLAAVGTGTLLLLLARAKQSDVDSAPTATAADLERLADLENTGRALTIWGNVFLIGGGIATIGGAVLATRQAKRPRESRHLSIAPVRGGFAVSFAGRF